MSKRRVPQKALTDIGVTRMRKLLELAEEAVREGNPERARRYVELARRIGAKTQVRFPREARVCDRCGIPMIPGVNCIVRLGDHRVCITCGMCGEVSRRPYIKEQSHD